MLNMMEEYLNLNKKIEDKLDELFDIYKSNNLDLDEAKSLLAEITDISHKELSNIKNPASYFLHCDTIAETSKSVIYVINRNYPVLEEILESEKGAYFGLVHDFIRTIVNDDGQKIHEIIALKYLQDKGLEDIAYATALHFVAPEMLKILQDEGKFLDIKQKKSNYLDILTIADAICTTKNLGKKDILLGFEERVKDIRERYTEEHLLIKSMNIGGEERLRNLTKKIDNLCNGKYSVDDVIRMYNLSSPRNQI